jgi:hypothetical protein
MGVAVAETEKCARHRRLRHHRVTPEHFSAKWIRFAEKGGTQGREMIPRQEKQL